MKNSTPLYLFFASLNTMRTILYLFILVFSVSLQAQENRLSFEFSYGLNSFKMGKVNEFYIDSFAKKEYINLLKDNVKQGQHYQFNVNYRPIGLFDIGVYGSYQFGNSKHTYNWSETGNNGQLVNNHKITNTFQTEALSVGLATSWYISHLLKLQQKENALNRLHFGVELNGGVGFSKVTLDTRAPSLPIISTYEFFMSRAFQGQAGIKVEYDLTKKPFFTTLGFRLGYQFFQTRTVKDKHGQEWVVLGQYPINLDFSGIYGAMYLKLGK